jgi:hypothetical protein
MTAAPGWLPIEQKAEGVSGIAPAPPIVIAP